MSAMRRAKKGKNPRRASRSAGIGGQLVFGPSVPCQKQYSIIVPANTIKYSDTAGGLTQVSNINAAQVNTFASRWGVVFEEYRIVKVVAHLLAVNNSQTGVSLVHWDEVNSGVPTLASAQNHRAKEIRNSPQAGESSVTMVWRPKDLNNEQWVQGTNTTFNPVYFKVYTDVANLGATSLTAQLFIVQFLYTIQFRGVI